MIIRQATRKDSKDIAECLLLAMEDIIEEFIGVNDPSSIREFMLYFTEKESNQYSYQNCFVAIHEGAVVGVINLYNGELLNVLREPIAQYIRYQLGKEFNPEDETQKGEWYIDSIGVSPQHQGKGFGKELLKYVIDYYTKNKGLTLGLLVDEANHKAEKLYQRFGFKLVGNKVLAGKRMKHMQLCP